MFRSLSLACLILVSSCTSSSSQYSRDQVFCKELKKWISAGPREGGNVREIAISHPKFPPDGPGVPWLFLMLNYFCQTECDDKADEPFVNSAVEISHSMRKAGWAEMAATCIGGSLNIGKEVKESPPVTLTKKYRGKLVTIGWSPSGPDDASDFRGVTTIKVVYPSK